MDYKKQPGDSGDPVADFDRAVRARCPNGPSLQSRQGAISVIARTRPDLHAAYLYATNQSRYARRVIEEKLDR